MGESMASTKYLQRRGGFGDQKLSKKIENKKNTILTFQLRCSKVALL
jgi:hypothetical protein